MSSHHVGLAFDTCRKIRKNAMQTSPKC